jgi:LmbE family N-acetylglucosaminyl deacetylase
LLAVSEVERAVWVALEREPTVADIRLMFGEQTDNILRKFIEREVCVLAACNWAPGRRRVLVFEPHSDDAALSIGATMWRRRHECEFTVVTMGGRSNFTSYYVLGRDYFDPEEISALRAAEGRLFARILGGHYVALQQNEAPLRYRDGRWTLQWFRRHRVSSTAFTNHAASKQELTAWKAQARKIIEERLPDELWFPLGAGSHADHELTRDALLDLLIEDPTLASESVVKLYQDVPYDGQFPHHVGAILQSLRRHGAVLEREDLRVDEEFAQKLRLLSVYASQFKVDAIRASVERSAALLTASDGAKVEPLHTLTVRPYARDSLEMYLDCELVGSTATRVSAWVRRCRTVDRLRILLLMPAGGFREDLDSLLREFPRASIHVYVSPTSASEVNESRGPRVHIHQVGRGVWAWMVLAFRLALQRPALTVFAAGDRYGHAKHLARMWPWSHTVVVPSLDHFMRGLRNELVRAGDPR